MLLFSDRGLTGKWFNISTPSLLYNNRGCLIRGVSIRSEWNLYYRCLKEKKYNTQELEHLENNKIQH